MTDDSTQHQQFDDVSDEKKRTIFCANLSDKITESLLYELFLQAGPLDRVYIPKDKDGRQRAFGFITYTHLVSVGYALSIFHGTRLFNRELTMRQSTGQNHNGPATKNSTNLTNKPSTSSSSSKSKQNSTNNSSQTNGNIINQSSSNNKSSRNAEKETKTSRSNDTSALRSAGAGTLQQNSMAKHMEPSVSRTNKIAKQPSSILDINKLMRFSAQMFQPISSEISSVGYGNKLPSFRGQNINATRSDRDIRSNKYNKRPGERYDRTYNHKRRR